MTVNVTSLFKSGTGSFIAGASNSYEEHYENNQDHCCQRRVGGTYSGHEHVRLGAGDRGGAATTARGDRAGHAAGLCLGCGALALGGPRLCVGARALASSARGIPLGAWALGAAWAKLAVDRRALGSVMDHAMPLVPCSDYKPFGSLQL